MEGVSRNCVDIGRSSGRGERRERRWIAGTLAPPYFESRAFSGHKARGEMSVGFWVEGWKVACSKAEYDWMGYERKTEL